MDQYAYIRTARRVYGKSIRQISKETGHSRNTIRKVLRREPYGYSRRSRQPYPILRQYLGIIDKWLKQDRQQPKKQRHTARRIYHRLVEEHGFQGSETTVRRYVRQAKVRLGMQATKAFIPLEPELGREAEVDWGTALAAIFGQVGKYKFFSMRSKSSGKHFVRFYPCERQQAFFDGHIRAFSFFGGVFSVLVYDNLSAAVRKVLRGKKRLEQEAFRRFHAYYNFTPRFCNTGNAHEKGGVEGLVGYVRRNYLVPIPEAATLEELNEKLLQQCLAYGEHRLQGRQETVNEIFEQEKSYLLALPEVPFSNIQTTDGKVDRYCTVIVDKNRYSVPSRYAGLKVRVSLSVSHVEIFHDGVRIARHQRLYGSSKWGLDPDHYLELIQRRPEAFHSARPIRQWRTQWPPCLERLLERFQQSQGRTKGIKDFISVLMLYREHLPDEVEAAVEKALQMHISCSQGVKYLLLPSSEASSASPPSLESWPALPPADVSVYGQLGGVL